MKKTINLNDFRNEFQAIRPNNFSYEGLERLYEYFEEYDSDYELDVIAICCEFVEMTLEEAIEAYDIDITYEDNVYSQVLDYIANNSIYVGDTPQGTIIFASF